MLALIAIILGLMASPSEEIIEWRKQSNGSDTFVIVDAIECQSGMRQSGYSYAPAGHVFIKQANLDGTVDLPACDGKLQ